MSYLKCSTLFMVFILLVACGPIYKTQYSYVPPRTSMGNMCISQCVQNKSMCEQMCQMKNQTCRLQAHQDALYQYENYRREQERIGKPIKRTVNDFEYTGACNEICSCDTTFNACYSACGGQVLERQVCVAFCDTGKK